MDGRFPSLLSRGEKQDALGRTRGLDGGEPTHRHHGLQMPPGLPGAWGKKPAQGPATGDQEAEASSGLKPRPPTPPTVSSLSPPASQCEGRTGP